MTGAGLYLHIPFCSRRCDYCDFFVVPGRDDLRGPYVEKLARDVAGWAVRHGGGKLRADTLYIGGGTPSRLEVEQIRRLVGTCREAFGLVPGAEVTLEANPEDLNPAFMAGCLESGVNRLSVGIQSLDDQVLRNRGRLHTGDQALAALGEARRAGFTRLNADLIAGLPAGEGSRAEADLAGELAGFLDRILEREPDHLSLYLLETDKEVPLMAAVAEGRERLPSDDAVADAYQRAVELLTAAGYTHYEISNFALPGRESRHNMKYWRTEPVLGFGPGAHSCLEGRRWSVPRDLEAYMRAAPGGEGRLDHTLADREAAVREALALELRLREGVDLPAFEERWGVRIREQVRERMSEVLEAGLVELEAGRLRLTGEGLLLANEVFQRLR